MPRLHISSTIIPEIYKQIFCWVLPEATSLFFWFYLVFHSSFHNVKDLGQYVLCCFEVHYLSCIAPKTGLTVSNNDTNWFPVSVPVMIAWDNHISTDLSAFLSAVQQASPYMLWQFWYMRLRLKSLGALFRSKIKKFWEMSKYSLLLDIKGLLFILTIATSSKRKFFQQKNCVSVTLTATPGKASLVIVHSWLLKV